MKLVNAMFSNLMVRSMSCGQDDLVKCESSKSIEKAKTLFERKKPYRIDNRIFGNVVIFSDHFLRTFREALTNGCTRKMTHEELLLLNDFIKFQNNVGLETDISDIERKNVLESLDRWVMSQLDCSLYDTDEIDCENTNFEYTECETNK